MIKASDILKQLDKCNSEYTFPILDNGYVYPAGTRLTAYRDPERWVIIVEIIGFSYRGGGHNGISNCLHIFGNCLNYKPGLQNENFLHITDDASNCNTFDEDEFFYLNPLCLGFKLRGEIVPIPHNRELYTSSGIDLEDESRINAFEFLRLLNVLYHDKLIATEAEIRERIPNDVPKIIEIHEWFHPDVINGELPSENETFVQIAQLLETGILEFYKPSRQPNTYWENWPEGGTL